MLAEGTIFGELADSHPAAAGHDFIRSRRSRHEGFSLGCSEADRHNGPAAFARGNLYVAVMGACDRFGDGQAETGAARHPGAGWFRPPEEIDAVCFDAGGKTRSLVRDGKERLFIVHSCRAADELAGCRIATRIVDKDERQLPHALAVAANRRGCKRHIEADSLLL